MTNHASYQRILLKLSGESLTREDSHFGVDLEACEHIATAIQKAHALNTKIGIVIGGGNFVRGHTLCEDLKIPKAKADQVGMLATLMNGLMLQRVLINKGCKARVLSAFACSSIAEEFDQDKALNYLENGEIVIFAGGTGNPYFTTDSAASLRACEIGAEVLLKATKVDGIYDKDPKKHSDAKKYDTITYNEILDQDLKVMDATAVSMLRENNIPIIVFNMYQEDNIQNVIQKKPCGTLVKG